MAVAKLVGWVLTGITLCIVVAVTSLAYIETLYMRAQLKKEIAELRKLKQEMKNAQSN